MQKLSSPKIRIVHRSGQDVLELSSPKRSSFFGFFSSSTALKEVSPKSSRPRVSSAHLAVVEHWVGLEEKIVHDYAEQKSASSKPAISSRVLGIFPQGKQDAPIPRAPKKEPGLFRFFTSLKPRLLRKTQTPAVKASLRKDSYPPISKVGLDERITHRYAEKKPVSSDRIAPSFVPATPLKQSPAAFETFNTQTTVSLPRPPERGNLSGIRGQRNPSSFYGASCFCRGGF
jgi:hypothetical protein